MEMFFTIKSKMQPKEKRSMYTVERIRQIEKPFGRSRKRKRMQSLLRLTALLALVLILGISTTSCSHLQVSPEFEPCKVLGVDCVKVKVKIPLPSMTLQTTSHTNQSEISLLITF